MDIRKEMLVSIVQEGSHEDIIKLSCHSDVVQFGRKMHMCVVEL